jgi:hypothetical protein
MTPRSKIKHSHFLAIFVHLVYIYDINVKKTQQFKHSVKDDQIIRQKLQISNLLVLEIILQVT